MALAGLFGFRETSGYRSPQANAAVGGVVGSLHQTWLAVDIILDDMSPHNRLDFMKAATRMGLKVIDEGDHLHLQIP